ncbi:hypothetical protein [Celeribacter sp.]|uniref:hypothetical protein n=1 Tax=Celeribacter sp. TaxID=1890673 RepID=UPI003A8FB8F3
MKDHPSPSHFARFIDGAYSMGFWFCFSGFFIFLGLLVVQDDLRHAVFGLLRDGIVNLMGP